MKTPIRKPSALGKEYERVLRLPHSSFILCLLAVFFCFSLPGHCEDLDVLEQQALSAAADRVAASVVRIETIGGLERVDKVLFGAGPTTGLVVDAKGYIISSAFNFVNKPASILVRMPDGSRKPAKLVARDHSRMFVLLKIEPDHPLTVPEVAPASEMRVGQWCIAMGRTFEDSRPNMAVGIVSAVGRIWGKAIQTDAPISPNNYGGPLVDIRGRAMGLLVPLSQQSAEEIAGMEWYDSGIGFAIPLETIQTVLPRLRKGEDLFAGVAGVFMESKNLYTGDTKLASCRPNSPAAKAGFKGGDRIIEIGGHKVNRTAEVRQEIGRRYAGDKLHFVVVRGEKRIEADLELVAKLEPYCHGFLGILPERSGDAKGVQVRYVYPDSPAADAKLAPGDSIASLSGKPVVNRDDLLREIAAFEPGMTVEVEVRHKDQLRKFQVKLASLPEGLPPKELPPAHPRGKPTEGQRPKVGQIALSVPEFKNEAWAYVPEGYDPSVQHGMIAILHGSTVLDLKALLAQWKPLCDANDLILVVPKARVNSGWQTDEAAFVEKLLAKVKSAYTVDSMRVAVFGRDSGAALGLIAAYRSRELIRAAAVIDAGSMLPPPETDPEHRLAIYLGTAKTSQQAQVVAATLMRLKAMKIPVTQKDLGKEARDLTPDELAELVRWFDTLDRI